MRIVIYNNTAIIMYYGVSESRVHSNANVNGIALNLSRNKIAVITHRFIQLNNAN